MVSFATIRSANTDASCDVAHVWRVRCIACQATAVDPGCWRTKNFDFAKIILANWKKLFSFMRLVNIKTAAMRRSFKLNRQCFTPKAFKTGFISFAYRLGALLTAEHAVRREIRSSDWKWLCTIQSFDSQWSSSHFSSEIVECCKVLQGVAESALLPLEFESSKCTTWDATRSVSLAKSLWHCSPVPHFHPSNSTLAVTQ